MSDSKKDLEEFGLAGRKSDESQLINNSAGQTIGWMSEAKKHDLGRREMNELDALVTAGGRIPSRVPSWATKAFATNDVRGLILDWVIRSISYPTVRVLELSRLPFVGGPPQLIWSLDTTCLSRTESETWEIARAIQQAAQDDCALLNRKSSDYVIKAMDGKARNSMMLGGMFSFKRSPANQ